MSAGPEDSEGPKRSATDPRVIQAKVRVPTARLDMVRRQRLLDRLDDARHAVVLVSAAAGSGKTVLLLDWLRQAERPAAWYSLDPLDNDPQRFFAHLVASFRAVDDDGFGAGASALEAAAAAGSAAGLAPALTDAPAHGVVVLDDVHQLENPLALDTVRALVEAAEAGGPRLVLLSRVDPPLRLARLRVSGALLEVRERDLRFTASEATDLFRRLLPEGLAPDLVARLGERTEGWAAGLRMAAAALDRVDDPAAAVDAFTGSHELMVDYLLEEVLGRQDEGMQRFLMETSILPRFTAAACQAVTGDPAAADRLMAIDDANLFLVSLDDRREWYRYHHLFAELLEFRLRRMHPDREEELRERASRWFEEQRDVQEALRQAAAMDGESRLLELLDRYGYAILARSEFASFARWLGRVTEPLSKRHPMFLVALAWFRFQSERAPDLDALLGAIDEAIDDPPAGYPVPRLRTARLHRGALRAFALRIADRLEEAVEAGEAALAEASAGDEAVRGILEFNMGAVHLRLANSEQARSYLERCYEANLRSGAAYLVLAGLAHLGYLTSQSGGVGPARQHLEAAAEFARTEGLDGLPAFGIVLYQLAQVHYLADELDAAREVIERAIALTRDERETDIQANVLIHSARVEAAAGDLDRAERHLAEAAALAHGHNVKPFATSLAVERARLAAARSGRLQTPESAPPSAEPAGRWSSVREAEVVLQLQHSLKLGRRGEARELARLLRTESEARGRGVALAVALMGEAATLEDAAARHEALEAALELAARHGYVRPLLQCGEPARALIEAGLKATSPPAAVRAFARELLKRFPRGDAPVGAADLATDLAADHDLTDREIEILALLMRGRTNKAMARELYVSVNTVKTHLKRVYGKLNVSTRTEAADRARAMGLRPDVTQ